MSKKKKSAIKFHGAPLLKGCFYYALVSTPAQIKEAIELYGAPETDLNPNGAVARSISLGNPDGQELNIVFMPADGVAKLTRKNIAPVVALLAHEAVHVKQHIVQFMGEKNLGDETEAYMIQEILIHLLDDLLRLSEFGK